jgi:hypothetical protein
MPRFETVKAMWEGFEKDVIPDDAPLVQVQEMRRAFYAGAWAMLVGCKSVGNDDVTEDEGVAQLESWRKECERFVAMMNMGRR